MLCRCATPTGGRRRELPGAPTFFAKGIAMARYTMTDGTVVGTKEATARVAVGTIEGQYGRISLWLHRSRKGRWWLLREFSWTEEDRSLDYGEWLTDKEACQRLVATGLSAEDLAKWPEVAKLYDEIME